VGEEGWLAVGGGWNGNHPYLMSFSYFPGGVLKMAAWHASLLATWPLGFISITFFPPSYTKPLRVALLVSRTFIRRRSREFSLDRSHLFGPIVSAMEKPHLSLPDGYLFHENAATRRVRRTAFARTATRDKSSSSLRLFVR